MSELIRKLNLVYAGSEYSGNLNKRRDVLTSDPVQEAIGYAKEDKRVEGFYFFSQSCTEKNGEKIRGIGTQYSPSYWIGKALDQEGIRKEISKMKGIKNPEPYINRLTEIMKRDKATHLVITRNGLFYPIKPKKSVVLDPNANFQQVYPPINMAVLKRSVKDNCVG